MKKTVLLFAIIFTAHLSLFSQNSINDYKYVIIPNKYDFLKDNDQYQLNSLTKFLFNKYGFKAFMEDETFPQDLQSNRCLAMYADAIEERGGLFKTKVKIDLKDCNGKLIMSSRIGETREKEFSKAYNLALRDAFVTYQNSNYSYTPNDAILVQKTSSSVSSKEVENSKAEIERLQKELEALKEKKETVVEKEEKPNVTQVIKETKKEVTELPKLIETKSIDVLYAQPIENGFQIVDTTPKKVMILYHSGIPNTFIVKDRNAIVYKKEDLWILAENDGNKLKTEVVNIKF